MSLVRIETTPLVPQYISLEHVDGSYAMHEDPYEYFHPFGEFVEVVHVRKMIYSAKLLKDAWIFASVDLFLGQVPLATNHSHSKGVHVDL